MKTCLPRITRSRNPYELSCLAILFVLLLFSHAKAQNPYTITVYVDEGARTAAEKVDRARYESTESNPSGTLLKNGHVFVQLSNGKINSIFGFYGLVPEKGGPIRVEKDLVDKGLFHWSKTYETDELGYHKAMEIVAKWNTDGKLWAHNHHCGDFAETVVRAAGVPLEDFPKSSGKLGGSRPGLWGRYLKEHGGRVNKYGGGGTDLTFAGSWVFEVASIILCKRSSDV